MSKEKKPKNELAVIVRGEIIESNFEEFALQVDAHLATINTDLKTDADFGKAKDDAKGLRDAEKNMKGIKVDLLEQLESVNDLFSKLDDKQESVRVKALELENLIKTKTAEVKKEIVDTAVAVISEPSRENYRAEILLTLKGKSKLDSMREGANSCAEDIELRHIANRVIISEYTGEHGASIAPDASKLLDIDPSDLREKLTARAELAKADAEKKRLTDELAEIKRKEMAAQAEVKRNDDLRDSASTTTGRIEQPEPRKIDSIPATTPDLVRTEDETERQEFDRFSAKVLMSFAEIKSPRAALKHPRNIEAAEKLAKGLLAAYTAFKNETYQS